MSKDHAESDLMKNCRCYRCRPTIALPRHSSTTCVVFAVRVCELVLNGVIRVVRIINSQFARRNFVNLER